MSETTSSRGHLHDGRRFIGASESLGGKMRGRDERGGGHVSATGDTDAGTAKGCPLVAPQPKERVE